MVKQMGTLETKGDRMIDLYTDGDISKEVYRSKKSSIQSEIETLRQELDKLGGLDTEMQRIEGLRDALLNVEEPYSGHYAFVGDLDQLDHDVLVGDHAGLVGNHLGYGSKQTAARRRQEFYSQVGLQVKVGQEMEISLDIGGSPVSKCVSSSCKTPTSRSSRLAS